MEKDPRCNSNNGQGERLPNIAAVAPSEKYEEKSEDGDAERYNTHGFVYFHATNRKRNERTGESRSCLGDDAITVS